MKRLFSTLIAFFLLSIQFLLSQDIVNNDFNIGYQNEIIEGDLSTNDELPNGATYTIIATISSPIGNNNTISLNTNGSYSFESNLSGKYIFNIESCQDGLGTQSAARAVARPTKHFSNNERPKQTLQTLR